MLSVLLRTHVFYCKYSYYTSEFFERGDIAIGEKHRKQAWTQVCLTLCTCAIYCTLPEQWICLGIQRHTHITGNNLIPLSVPTLRHHNYAVKSATCNSVTYSTRKKKRFQYCSIQYRLVPTNCDETERYQRARFLKNAVYRFVSFRSSLAK